VAPRARLWRQEQELELILKKIAEGRLIEKETEPARKEGRS
jgi:hypothetical protein